MLYSTRSKLIVSLLGVSFLVGGVSLLVGGQLLYKTVLDEATSRISLDLNAAREIVSTRIKRVRTALNVVALGEEARTAARQQDCARLIGLLKEVAQQTEMDFLGMTTGEGKTLCRIGPNPVPKDPDRIRTIRSHLLQIVPYPKASRLN